MSSFSGVQGDFCGFLWGDFFGHLLLSDFVEHLGDALLDHRNQ